MKFRASISFALMLIVGFCAGWFANAYWEKKVRKAQSTMALIKANEAAQGGDLDKAIEYASYAILLDSESPLADIQKKEFTNKRAAKIAASCESSVKQK